MKKTISLLILFVLFAGQLHASDDFSFFGDRLSSVRAKGREQTVLRGNAGIVSSSTSIKADYIEIFGDDNEFAECTGNVEVRDNEKGIFLKAGKLFFNREDDIIRAEGSAVMEDARNEVVARGNFLEYRGKDEVCMIQIGVRIFKDEMVCRSEFAEYSRNDEILRLSGMPVVYREDDEYRALRIIIDIDKDEITLEGRVSGKIFSEDNENDETEEIEESEETEEDEKEEAEE